VLHGLNKRKRKAPEYGIWNGMLERCRNPLNVSFHNYGGRGIKVCASWAGDFTAFYGDVGPRPSPRHTLDRIDNNGNYEPGNVRWATQREQSLNRRNCQIEAHEPEQFRWLASLGYTQMEISRHFEVRYKTVNSIVLGKTWK
jgi:hypothetical protein